MIIQTAESKTETAAAMTEKVVTEDLNHTDGTTDRETYGDDFELLFCQQGDASVKIGVFDYYKACNQVLSQMVSIEVSPWWVLLDN